MNPKSLLPLKSAYLCIAFALLAGFVLIVSFTYVAKPGKSHDTSAKTTVSNVRSIYTPLTEEKCKLIDTSDEGGYSLQSCPGVLGYQLQVEDFDARMTVTVVDPDNNEHPQNYSQNITGHFSELGKTAEWRIGKVDGKEAPVALIVRVYSQDLENVNKQIPYLAVSKITPDEICVTDRVHPGPKQNEQAQQAADKAINSNCLESGG